MCVSGDGVIWKCWPRLMVLMSSLWYLFSRDVCVCFSHHFQAVAFGRSSEAWKATETSAAETLWTSTGTFHMGVCMHSLLLANHAWLQTLLKTEILKNQLQIASTISQGQTSALSTTGGAAATVLNSLVATTGGSLNFNSDFSDSQVNGAGHGSSKWVNFWLI